MSPNDKMHSRITALVGPLSDVELSSLAGDKSLLDGLQRGLIKAPRRRPGQSKSEQGALPLSVAAAQVECWRDRQRHGHNDPRKTRQVHTEQAKSSQPEKRRNAV